jgi:UDP-2,3-diacylglucosamine pyrophosphatase LpxH
MITNLTTKKMVVISDLHFGNPFSSTTHIVLDFIKWAASQDYDICINGDGLEVAQASLSKMVTEMPEVVRTIKNINKQNHNIYYIVGNHDMAFENFLEDWGYFKVSPFLNVQSGDSRIRIEHGHIYDPLFVKYPRLYEKLTHFGGLLLKISPSLYKSWIAFEKWRAQLRAKKTGIIGEPPEFQEAAREISQRGFDCVVFGHTHHPGEVFLENEKRYLNPGSWLLSCHYVEINNGHVSLKIWDNSKQHSLP